MLAHCGKSYVQFASSPSRWKRRWTGSLYERTGSQEYFTASSRGWFTVASDSFCSMSTAHQTHGFRKNSPTTPATNHDRPRASARSQPNRLQQPILTFMTVRHSDQFLIHMDTILAEANAGEFATKADVDRRRNELIQSSAATANPQQVNEPAAKLAKPPAKTSPRSRTIYEICDTHNTLVGPPFTLAYMRGAASGCEWCYMTGTVGGYANKSITLIAMTESNQFRNHMATILPASSQRRQMSIAGGTSSFNHRLQQPLLSK